ncbi:peptidylprolyl isomerase [Rickettsiales bacterium]|nr:peptidylprolyl isomerase [Rickettsiales bacterium]
MTTNKNNIKIIAVVATAIIALITILLISKKSNDSTSIVAEINNSKIHRSDVEEKLSDIFQSQNRFSGVKIKTPKLEEVPQEIIKVVAREVYIDQKLLVKAKKSGIQNKESIKNKIANIKKEILIKGYIDDVIEKEITDQAISETYNDLRNDLNGKKEYEFHHIVFKTESEAKKIYNQLKKRPSKFASYAKKHSLDKNSAKNGGKIGFIIEDGVSEEVTNILKKLKKNTPSKPVKTSYGWHIIKYSNIKDASPLPFEKVKDNIKNQLTQKKINEIKNNIFNDAEINVLIEFEDPLKDMKKESSNDNKKEEIKEQE